MTGAPAWRQRLRRWLLPAGPGLLRRTAPVSDVWGFDRGTPVDRHYIEGFLAAHRGDIRGRVLEVKDSAYTDRFGRGVESREVLDIDATNPQATLIADLTDPEAFPEAAFDCFILTQTLHLLWDVQAGARSAWRLLRPGGVLLATAPAVSRISRGAGLDGDFWRFTPAALRRLLEGPFGTGQVTVQAYGNVLTAIAALTGMAREEIPRRRLDQGDDFFPVIVAARAVKDNGRAGTSTDRHGQTPGEACP